MGASPKFSCPIPANRSAFSFSRRSRSARLAAFSASFCALAAALAARFSLFFSEASWGSMDFSFLASLDAAAAGAAKSLPNVALNSFYK